MQSSPDLRGVGLILIYRASLKLVTETEPRCSPRLWPLSFPLRRYQQLRMWWAAQAVTDSCPAISWNVQGQQDQAACLCLKTISVLRTLTSPCCDHKFPLSQFQSEGRSHPVRWGHISTGLQQIVTFSSCKWGSLSSSRDMHSPTVRAAGLPECQPACGFTRLPLNRPSSLQTLIVTHTQTYRYACILFLILDYLQKRHQTVQHHCLQRHHLAEGTPAEQENISAGRAEHKSWWELSWTHMQICAQSPLGQEWASPSGSPGLEAIVTGQSPRHILRLPCKFVFLGWYPRSVKMRVLNQNHFGNVENFVYAKPPRDAAEHLS